MPIEKNCAVCNEIFLIKPNQINKLFCCSKECSSTRAKTIFLGNKNPNYKNAGKRPCVRCGAEYQSYNKKSKYCSHLCSDLSNRKNESTTTRELKKNKKPKELKIKKENKKNYCSVCKSKEVNRRVKYCKECRSKKEKIIGNCKTCKKEILSHKSRIRKFCSQKCYDRSGENNTNYVDGRTPENKRQRNSKQYSEWRTSVFKRDNYKCVWCGSVGDLNADHIKPFSKFPELRLDIDNGRTLCIPCHKKTDSYLKNHRHL